MTMTLHYRPPKKTHRQINLKKMLVIGGGTAILFGITYFFMQNFFSPNALQQIPFIKSNYDQAIKTKPPENLNQRLPHADKMIYNEIDNQAVPFDQSTQNMLELPEEPITSDDILPVVDHDNETIENTANE